MDQGKVWARSRGAGSFLLLDGERTWNPLVLAGGGEFGISITVSVGFGICLMDIAGGKMLWKGCFEETRRFLSENILDPRAFFKKWAKWLNADDLARFGIKKIFKKYPY